MKRRSFLQTTTTAAVSLPLALNGLQIGAFPKSALFQFLNPDSDRVLVLIQLNGGNDGLHTLVPLDQYDKLANVRQNIILPESSLLPITDTAALHPVMGGMQELWDQGKLSALQSVGYPNQNRSHFRSMDIWHTASEADEYLSTGWLGRYLDTRHPGYPDDYPNADHPDPLAITIGSLVSETCQGSAVNFSMALTNPFDLGQLLTGGDDTVPNTPYGEELTFLRDMIAQTNAYTDVITEAANQGANSSSLYDDNNPLAQQLKTIALLISGGLKTKIYIASIGGFDTHANQVVDGEPTQGEHAVLLQSVSDAVRAFQDDLANQGLEERVLGMTYSEFGRQIASNFSFGTDHGTAAPMFFFGSCVNPGIIGDNPEVPDQVEPQEGVPMQYDFRSMYGSVLMDWFDVPESEVKNLLSDAFQYIPIVDPCAITNTENRTPIVEEELEVYNFPNPFREQTTIVFHTANEDVRVSIFNPLGQEMEVIANRRFSTGEHQLYYEARNLPAGNYYVRVQTKDRVRTRMMVKQ